MNETNALRKWEQPRHDPVLLEITPKRCDLNQFLAE